MNAACGVGCGTYYTDLIGDFSTDSIILDILDRHYNSIWEKVMNEAYDAERLFPLDIEERYWDYGI